MSIEVTLNLSNVIMRDDEAKKRIDYAMQAGMFIAEEEYVRQAPGDTGSFKQGIQVKKNTILDYVIQSTAKRKGFNYPLALYTGTRKMKGMPDFGFTTGRVRSNTVAYGIGGVRPNKAALRAKNIAGPKFIKFVASKIQWK